MSTPIDPDTLAEAAIVLHDVLTRANLPHVFLGGFQLLLHGSPRGSKDVDVEINKPMFKGYEKIYNALKEHGNFIVFDGNRKDAVSLFSPLPPLMLTKHIISSDPCRMGLKSGHRYLHAARSLSQIPSPPPRRAP